MNDNVSLGCLFSKLLRLFSVFMTLLNWNVALQDKVSHIGFTHHEEHNDNSYHTSYEPVSHHISDPTPSYQGYRPPIGHKGSSLSSPQTSYNKPGYYSGEVEHYSNKPIVHEEFYQKPDHHAEHSGYDEYKPDFYQTEFHKPKPALHNHEVPTYHTPNEHDSLNPFDGVVNHGQAYRPETFKPQHTGTYETHKVLFSVDIYSEP